MINKKAIREKLERCRTCKHYGIVMGKYGLLRHEHCKAIMQQGHYANCVDIGIGNQLCRGNRKKKTKE